MLATAGLLTGCARTSDIEIVLPDSLGGLRAAPAVGLDVERVAADALDRAALTALLAEAGFERATERTYTGSGPGIRRVQVRVVRFQHPQGAERYLSWLRSHVQEVIGEVADAEETPTGPIFIHEPGGCCPKELPLAMASWRSGVEVVRILVAGPAVDGPRGAALVARLRELLAPGT